MGKVRTFALLGASLLVSGALFFFLLPPSAPEILPKEEPGLPLPVPSVSPRAGKRASSKAKGKPSSAAAPEGERRKVLSPEEWRAALAEIRGRVLWADGSPAGGLTVEAYGEWEGPDLLATPGKEHLHFPPPMYWDDDGDAKSWVTWLLWDSQWNLYPDPEDWDLDEETKFYLWDSPIPPPFSEGRTREDGTFLLQGLPPGTHVLLALKEKGTLLGTFYNALPLEPEGTTRIGDITLPHFGRIQGQVFGPGGKPAPGAKVLAFPSFPVALHMGPALANATPWVLFIPFTDEDVPSFHRIPEKGNRMADLGGFPSALTDERGRFTLPRVREGEAALFVSWGPYRTRFPVPLRVQAGSSNPLLEIHLPRGETMRIHVLDEENRPLSGIQVMAAESASFENPVFPRDAGVTDSSGALTVEGLGPGRIFLLLRESPAGPWFVSGPWALGSSPTIRFRVTEKKAFSCVDGDSGNPITPEEVRVSYFGSSRPLEIPWKILGEGRFLLQGLAPGSYRLTLGKKGWIKKNLAFDVLPREKRNSTSVRVKLERGTPLTLRVLDPEGKPVVGARVLATDEGPWKDNLDAFCLGPEITDSHGTARLGSAPRKPLFISLLHPGFSFPVTKKIEPPFPPLLPLRLEKAGKIEGKVEGIPPGTNKKEIRVILSRWSHAPGLSLSPLGEQDTFLFKAVPPGKYFLHLEFDSKPIPVTTLGLSTVGPFPDPFDLPGTELTLGAGETKKTKIYAAWFFERGNLQGTVTLDGRPLPGAKIVVRHERVPPRRTDSKGMFFFSGLLEDPECLVSVFLPSPGRIQGEIPLGWKSVEIHKGKTTTCSFSIQSGKADGCVLDAHGSPVPGCLLRISNDRAPFFLFTDRKGRFSMDCLPINPRFIPPGSFYINIPKQGLTFLNQEPFLFFRVFPGKTTQVTVKVARTLPVPILFQKPSPGPFQIKAVRYIPGLAQASKPIDDRGYGEDGSGQVVLPPGPYTVQVWNQEKGRLRVWEGFLQVRPASEKRILVPLEKSLDPLQKWGRTYSGRVLDPKTKKGIQGTLFLGLGYNPRVPSSTFPPFKTQTNRQGEFSLRVIPGCYTVKFKKNGKKDFIMIDFWREIPPASGERDILLFKKV